MNTTLSSKVTEDELRLRMDRRTVAQQESEIRHLRVRLEKLAAKQALLESVNETQSEQTLAA